jgi:hypothetical protein
MGLFLIFECLKTGKLISDQAYQFYNQLAFSKSPLGRPEWGARLVDLGVISL